MKKQKSIKAWALIFDKSFTYYGGHLDRLAIFTKKECAEAFGNMFIVGKNKNKYKVKPVLINPLN